MLLVFGERWYIWKVLFCIDVESHRMSTSIENTAEPGPSSAVESGWKDNDREQRSILKMKMCSVVCGSSLSNHGDMFRKWKSGLWLCLVKETGRFLNCIQFFAVNACVVVSTCCTHILSVPSTVQGWLHRYSCWKVLSKAIWTSQITSLTRLLSSLLCVWRNHNIFLST